MLHAGNDCVPPTSGMWPLLCHEVSLSYDQEERMRHFQRSMLSTPSSWIERHTVLASSKLVESLGDSMNRAPEMLRCREAQVYNGLTTTQKLKFLSWANKNKQKVSMIAAKFSKSCEKSSKAEENSQLDCSTMTSSKYHNAANLYILDRILRKRVLQKLPPSTAVPTLPSKMLKKLGNRPSFESLSNMGKENHNNNNIISSDSSMTSYPSSGSLKRPSSSISNSDNMDLSPHSINTPPGHNNSHHISPEVAQAKAANYVAQLLKPAGIVPQVSSASPNATNVQPYSSLPPPPTPNTPYYQPEHVTSKTSPVVSHNNNYRPPPPPPQQHRHQSYQYPTVEEIMPYPIHCNPNPAPASLPMQSNVGTYQQYHSNHHSHPNYHQSVPASQPIQRRQDFSMKPVPEEHDVIPVTNNPAHTPHHGHTSSTADFLLDLAEDWTIEGKYKYFNYWFKRRMHIETKVFFQ